MENNLGITFDREPEVRIETVVENKKSPVFLTGLLSIILIVAYIFTLKNYEPVKNVIITGGIVVYPLTFLIVAIISKYYGFKEARKSIFISALLYVVFILLVMICVFPHANNITSGYNAVVQYVFTNNSLSISPKWSLFYPTLGQFFGLLIAYVSSHLIYSVVYNAIYRFTVDYLAMGLGLFIAFVVDRLLFIPILFAKGLKDGANTFEYVIQCLTSEFISSIIITIIIIIVYSIITTIKKVKN